MDLEMDFQLPDQDELEEAIVLDALDMDAPLNPTFRNQKKVATSAEEAQRTLLYQMELRLRRHARLNAELNERLRSEFPEVQDLDVGAPEAACDTSESSGVSVSSQETGDLTGSTTSSRSGRRRSKQKCWSRRPMGICEAIVNLQDPELREATLRSISRHLSEKCTEDPPYYREAAFYLFSSFTTVNTLLQELLIGHQKLAEGELNQRGAKRLCNVVTLLQTIASNSETREDFVAALLPNYLIPFISSKYTEESFEQLRAACLSVFAILCQSREDYVITWALESGIVGLCIHAAEFGIEVAKVVALHTLECICLHDYGLNAICDEASNHLELILKLYEDMVMVLGTAPCFSPRLVFHIIRSYLALCQHPRALKLIIKGLPREMKDSTFQDILQTYPIVRQMHRQLLLCTGGTSQALAAPGVRKYEPQMGNKGNAVKGQPSTSSSPGPRSDHCNAYKPDIFMGWNNQGNSMDGFSTGRQSQLSVEAREKLRRFGLLDDGPAQPVSQLQNAPSLFYNAEEGKLHNSVSSCSRLDRVIGPASRSAGGTLIQYGFETKKEHVHLKASSITASTNQYQHLAVSQMTDGNLGFTSYGQVQAAETQSLNLVEEETVRWSQDLKAFYMQTPDDKEAETEAGTPLRPVNFNMEMWESAARKRQFDLAPGRRVSSMA